MKSEHLKFSEKLGYGLGDMASNFFFQTFILYLLFFYTDVFGLPAAAVGLMFLVTRVWDAVSDPMMGVIADRTKTRWGRFRPYLLWMSIPYGLIGFAMFANPDLSQTGKLIYAYVTYTLMMTVYTAINVPYSALMGVMSHSSQERAVLSSFRFVLAFTGGFFIASMIVPLKNFLGGGDEAMGWRLTMAFFAVCSIALFMVTFATTKERIDPPRPAKGSILKDFKDLARNRPWVVLFFAAIFNLTNVAIRDSSGLFFFKYFLEDESLFPIFGGESRIAIVLGLLCTGFLTRRFDKRHIMIVCMSFNAASFAAFFFVQPDQIWLMHFLNTAGAFAAGPSIAVTWAMYADVADYSEWKLGRRTTGLIFSASQFAQKFGLAIGGFFGAQILGFFGYVPNVVQTEESLLGIRLMFSLIPAALAGLAIVAIFFYNIDRPLQQRIEKELGERHAALEPRPEQ